MGKLCFEPRTLDDEVMRDGLCAVGALDEDPNTTGFTFVTSGMAAQSYLPTACRRYTYDIDVSILKPLSLTELKDYVKPMTVRLEDLGYETDVQKGWASNRVIFSKRENAESSAVIEFTRRSKGNFEKNFPRLQREFENTRKKIVEDRDVTYRVASPEDIAMPKIVRSIGTLSRNPGLSRYIGPKQPVVFTPARIKKDLEGIKELRCEAVMQPGDIKLSENLRFFSDLFDIRAMSDIVGFNEKYLLEVIDSWDVLKRKTPSRDFLAAYVLPRVKLDF